MTNIDKRVSRQPRQEPRLRDFFAEDFTIGAAVNVRTIASQEELLAYHFNSLTAENEMKFESVHPEESTYTFEEADRIAAFARKHGMKLRGHTLVWHNQTSGWLFERPGGGGRADKSTLLARMKEHIETVVGRYKQDIYAWDVVNEVIADEGEELLRKSKWQEIAGDEFIARAFEYAHVADPNAQLFYNDYHESKPFKRDRIYALVKSLVERGVPIHGVGLQAHWNVEDPSMDDFRAAMEKYASLGLRLQLTELDMSVYAAEDRRTDLKAPTEEMLEKQAERYGALFRVLREYREHVDSVTFWGAADDYTWLNDLKLKRTNWPFLFDEKHAPKPAFWRVAGGAAAKRE